LKLSEDVSESGVLDRGGVGAVENECRSGSMNVSFIFANSVAYLRFISDGHDREMG